LHVEKVRLRHFAATARQTSRENLRACQDEARRSRAKSGGVCGTSFGTGWRPAVSKPPLHDKTPGAMLLSAKFPVGFWQPMIIASSSSTVIMMLAGFGIDESRLRTAAARLNDGRRRDRIDDARLALVVGRRRKHRRRDLLIAFRCCRARIDELCPSVLAHRWWREHTRRDRRLEWRRTPRAAAGCR